MDGNRFDSLTRALADRRNRRSVLKILLGLGGGAAARQALTSDADARTSRNRPTVPPPPPTTTTLPPPSTTLPPDPCPGALKCSADGCCAGGACTPDGRCCPAGTARCGNECCLSADQCCDGECCANGSVCIGEERCCAAEFACGGVCCNGTGQQCCNGICLQPGVCCNDDDCPDSPATCQVGICDAAAGTCGLSAPCTDTGECADASCNPDGTCSYTDNDAHCDDGLTCTRSACTDRVCVHPFDCSLDPDQCCPGCLDCQPGGGCATNALNCAATGVDGCLVGSCMADGTCFYAPDDARCTATNECLVGRCSVDGSCSYEPSDGRCADLDPCTLDTCNTDGTCSHEVDCRSNPNVCCVGCRACNGETGQCDAILERCTQTGACRVATSCEENGACVYESDHSRCDDGNECTSDACLSINDGTCFSLNLPGTASCQAGKGHCSNGACICNCVTDGECFALGEENPANACQTCTEDGWFPQVSACFTLNPCQTASCAGGQCVISDKAEGATCQAFTLDPCKQTAGTCQAGQCVSSNLNKPNGTFCFSESCVEDEFCQSCQCLDGVCAPGPANLGQLCGVQPEDECQVRTCDSNGQCTLRDKLGTLGRPCQRSNPCELGICAYGSDPIRSCKLASLNRCEITPPNGCTDVICNSETGECDVLVGHPNGQRFCISSGDCCPTQYCYFPLAGVVSGTCWNLGEAP